MSSASCSQRLESVFLPHSLAQIGSSFWRAVKHESFIVILITRKIRKWQGMQVSCVYNRCASDATFVDACVSAMFHYSTLHLVSWCMCFSNVSLQYITPSKYHYVQGLINFSVINETMDCFQLQIICLECCFQDGGSLDLILKKAGRLPEPIIGMISLAVSGLVE